MDPLTLSLCHMNMPNLGMPIFTQLTHVSVIFTTAIMKATKLIPFFLESAICLFALKGHLTPYIGPGKTAHIHGLISYGTSYL